MDYDTAYEEMIADSMEGILSDGKVLEKWSMRMEPRKFCIIRHLRISRYLTHGTKVLAHETPIHRLEFS